MLVATDGRRERRQGRRDAHRGDGARRTSPATTSRRTIVESERRIAEEKAREEGKPEQALPRIVEGRVDAFFKDNVLLEQTFAKDQRKTVSQVLKEAGVNATGFARFKVGA